MKIRPQAILGGIVVAIALSACTDMSGLAPHAALADANRLAAAESLRGARLSPSAWPGARWWTRFDDPQLDALMSEAMADSPSLRIATARVRKAQASAAAAGSSLAPGVDGSLASTEQRYSEHDIYPPPLAGSWNTENRAALDFGYDFDFWGRNRAAAAAALGRAKAAEVDAAAARLMLSVAIGHAYVGLQRGFAQRDIAEAVQKQREHILDLTRQRFAAGLDSNVELRQAEAALPGIRERISRIDEAIALSRNQLAALLGQGPDRGLAIARPRATLRRAPALPTDLPAELLGRRPDVVAQRLRVEAAAKDIAVAKAQFYPDINLAAFIGLQSIGLSQFLKSSSGVAGIGPALSLPVFDGGRRRSALAGRDAEYDMAVEQYNQTLITALHEVADPLSSLRAVSEQRRQQRLASRRAQQSYELSLLRYRQGIAGYLQVLSAEAAVLGQKSRAADLDARELDLSIDLIRALGGGYDVGAGAAVAREKHR